MSFITITGPHQDIDRMVEQYLSNYEMHLENALTELQSSKGLRPYTSPNPYAPYVDRVNSLWEYLGKEDATIDQATTSKPSFEDLQVRIEEIETVLKPHLEKERLANAELKQKEESLEMISSFKSVDYPIDNILSMDHIRFRFGRFKHSNYEKFQKYVLDITASIFIEGSRDDDYIYGVYFTPEQSLRRVDALYISMNWERIFVPDEADYIGTPKEIIQRLSKRIAEIKQDITETHSTIEGLLTTYKPAIIAAKDRLETLSENFNIRKYAALTHDEFVQKETRYLLMGWMTSEDALQFVNETDGDPNIVAILEDDSKPEGGGMPPTKIQNLSIFKPYEMFVKMYGVPNYREFDPTWFVALTYSLLFGIMFGDVGQGAFLTLGGYYLYKKKKADLGGIIALAGFFSTIFGFMYGSVFGFENIINAMWLHPMTAMIDLPFIGTINTVFVVAIAFGMFLILTTLVFNIMSELKTRESKEVIFDRNGIAGLVFYGSLVVCIVLFMTGNPLPAGILLVLLFGLPLLMMALKEPIMAKLEEKELEGDDGVGMLAVQAFFEIFEILLSYFSNTLSFVRVGAFAVSHAAMMQVVLMLAGATEGGDINWIIVVLGNIFVVGLEGLVVGIQVLRLEFYEIFSHFYKGDGRPFENHILKK